MPRQIRTLVVEGGYEFYAQALEKAFGKDGVFMVNVVDDIAVLAATLGSGDYRVRCSAYLSFSYLILLAPVFMADKTHARCAS
jgi:hypothetical protein